MILSIIFHLSNLYSLCYAQPQLLNCDQSCQAVKIVEELPPGTVINSYRFSDTEASSLTFTLTYSSQQNIGSIYYLSITTGNFECNLTVGSRIDREDFVLNNRAINFYLTAIGVRAQLFNFYVSVIDIDDNWPVFESQPFNCPMTERNSSEICDNLTVADPDQINSFCAINITYVSSGLISDFAVNVTLIKAYKTGFRHTFQILLRKSLNYKRSPKIQMQILAVDSAGHATYGNVIISVVEIRNNPPVFLDLVYSRRIDEEMEIGTNIVTVQAVDGDLSVNGLVIYSLLSGNPFNQYFSMNITNGLLNTAQRIDRDSADIFSVFGFINLTAIATVQYPLPSKSSEISVLIQILDINDSPVVFSENLYKGTIPENSVAGVPVFTTKDIIAKDLDYGENAQYSLTVVQNDVVSDAFEIYPASAMNKATLKLIVKNGSFIDYESVQFINVTIVATQTAPVANISKFSYVFVSIQILDINENRPTFVNSSYSFSIYENPAYLTPIGVVEAIDKDRGTYGMITYSLDDPFNKFAINSTSGLISVNVPADMDLTLIDREVYASFDLIVKATDGGGLTALIQVVINLLDVNDNSPIFNVPVYHVWLTENTYNILPRPLQVKATDKDVSPQNNLIHFQIADIITGPKLYLGNFNINSSTGEISVIQPVDREIIPYNILELQILASDVINASFSDTCVVKIIILDFNDNAPILPMSYYLVVIAKNISDNFTIFFLNATDADEINTPNSDITYRLTGKDSQQFSVEPIQYQPNSVIISRDPYAHLVPHIYNFTIIAYDHGYPSLSSSAVITVNVTEVNDRKPSFNQTIFLFSIKENLPQGTFVGQVVATDPDINNNLSYSIIYQSLKAFNSNGANVQFIYDFSGSIYMNSSHGAVFIQSPLDSKKVVKLVFQIQVVDLAAETSLTDQTDNATLVINILDVNDDPPAFLASVFYYSIPENFPFKSDTTTGATNFYVYATNVNTAGTLQFNYLDPSNSFSIDSKTGQIFLIKSLDRETMSSINITVWCGDGVFIVNATVVMTIIDINDNAPYFTDNVTVITISQVTQVNTILATFTAEDKDTGEYARISFYVGNNNEILPFTLTLDGILILSHSLIFNQIFIYNLSIVVIDNPNGNAHLNNSKQVTINIRDYNCHYPTFEKTFYEFDSIQDNQVIGYKIGEVLATDQDLGENGNITYALMLAQNSDDPAILSLFKVQKVNGKAQILVDSSLLKRSGRFTMILKAMDNGIPQLYNNCTVVVTIIEMNNYSPNFTNLNPPVSGDRPRYSIKENTIDLIATITTYDADSGINAKIIFNIFSQNGDYEYFLITPISGILSNIRPFDREIKDLYVFTILASDLGVPSRTSSVEIEVAILDVDDNLPIFPPEYQNINISVYEGKQDSYPINNSSLKGFKIYNVATAIDRDIGENALIAYIMIGDTYPFYLDPFSGDLYGLEEFDRETRDSYKLTVKAIPRSRYRNDSYPYIPGYSQFNSSESQILIIILDINDNPPQFTTPLLIGAIFPANQTEAVIIDVSKYVEDKDLVSQNNLSFSIVKIFPITDNLAKQLRNLNVESIFLLNSKSGKLSLVPGTKFQNTVQGYIEMTIGVSDGKFQNTSQCIIYFINPTQRLIAVLRSYPLAATLIGKHLTSYLSENLGLNVISDSIELATDLNGNILDGTTNVYLYAVNLYNNTVVDGQYLLTQITQLTQGNNDFLNKYQIIKFMLVSPTLLVRQETECLYKLILIVFVSVVGLLLCIIFICICLYRSRYQSMLKAYGTSSVDTTEVKSPTKLPGTNFYENSVNPLSRPNMMKSFDYSNSRPDEKGVKPIGVPVYGNEITFDQLFPSDFPLSGNSTFREATETVL